jgi:hypothetical protein
MENHNQNLSSQEQVNSSVRLFIAIFLIILGGLDILISFFGIGNILPVRMKLIGQLNTYLLIISFVAVVIGVILQKVN